MRATAVVFLLAILGVYGFAAAKAPARLAHPEPEAAFLASLSGRPMSLIETKATCAPNFCSQAFSTCQGFCNPCDVGNYSCNVSTCTYSCGCLLSSCPCPNHICE
jgi:hypothetical protein